MSREASNYPVDGSLMFEWEKATPKRFVSFAKEHWMPIYSHMKNKKVLMKINNETVCHKNKNTRVIIYSSKSSRGLRLPEDCPRNCPNKYFIILLKCEDRRKEIDHKIHFLLRRVLFKRNFPAVKLFYKLVFSCSSFLWVSFHILIKIKSFWFGWKI